MNPPGDLLELISAIKPRAAVFTTFTFSVSHFDAVLLPALRSVGCQDIVVLLDANEAAVCARESRSRAAGRVYRVAPVLAPGGGVFHSKLAYLAAEPHDVLAVSSGNLTASGQSLQLESFDSVTAEQAPGVFLELSRWMELLAAAVADTSAQAAEVLQRTAPRARQAYRSAGSARASALPAPALVHTLDGPARATLEALFIAEADYAESIDVLSPFHAPDGGPVLRLAASVQAKTIVVGLDGGRARLAAPFAEDRFASTTPVVYGLPDTPQGHKRLHAKVFQLHAADKALVMTGSINATAQSFESDKNVEVSLARWLPSSPFKWKLAQPDAFEVTQQPSDFQARPQLYVEAWLSPQWTLHGRVVGRGSPLDELSLTVHTGDALVFETALKPELDGRFSIGPLPEFDLSKSTLVTVVAAGECAKCWLNIQAELELSMEERERRSAINRLLRGGLAFEDIAEAIRMLSMAAQGLATARGACLVAVHEGADDHESEVPFSFLRWQTSNHSRGITTSVGRNTYELLKAVCRYMRSRDEQDADLLINHLAANAVVQAELQNGEGTEGAERAPAVDPLLLLDQVCLSITAALERRADFEHAGLLAEVVAARAVHRALTHDLKMAPCLSWLERFSQVRFDDKARAALSEVAVVMACLVVVRLEAAGLEAKPSVLRADVERLAQRPLLAAEWTDLCEAGLRHESLAQVRPDATALAAAACKLSEATTLADSLLALLRLAVQGRRVDLAQAPASRELPEIMEAAALKKVRKADLLRGLLGPADLARPGLGCPLCDHVLSAQHLASLRQKHVALHKAMRCNRLLTYSDEPGRLRSGLQELPDA